MGRTSIEWTDMSLNPGIYGCAEVSPACAHCYAAGMAHRLGAMQRGRHDDAEGDGWGYASVTRRNGSGVHWTGEVRVDFGAIGPAFARLPGPRAPKRVFVTSMADLFHVDVPDDFIMRVFVEMASRPWHTFQVLTKRPERVDRWLRDYALSGICPQWAPWPPNVWIGTTVEDQRRADERIPHLLRVPARVRFLSCEPLLGPVDLPYGATVDGEATDDVPGIHWVIAGGESGSRARPSHPDWFRSLRDQCQAAGVPLHFKQWGEFRVSPSAVEEGDYQFADGTAMVRIGKAAAGRLLDGRTWDDVPALDRMAGEPSR